MGINDPRLEEIKLKISFLTATINLSLEGIIQASFPKDKPQIIKLKLFSKMQELKMRMSLIVEFINKQQDPEVVDKVCSVFKISKETQSNGFNSYTTEFMIDVLQNEIIDPALEEWPSIDKTANRLLKRMLTFWRKLDIVINDLGKALFASKDCITNLPPEHPEWIHLADFTDLFRAGTKDEINAAFEKENNFLLMGQIAHARSIGVYFNPGKISEEELRLHLEPSFSDYEDFMVKNDPNRIQLKFKNDYAPDLGPSFWKNLVKSMANKDKAYVDLNFYLCFINQHSIKDFWCAGESYLGKITRHAQLVKVGLSKRVFIRCRALQNIWTNDKTGMFNPKMLIDKSKRVEFEDEDFISQRIFQEKQKRETIGIRLICKHKFHLKKHIREYAKELGLSLVKKQKISWWSSLFHRKSQQKAEEGKAHQPQGKKDQQTPDFDDVKEWEEIAHEKVRQNEEKIESEIENYGTQSSQFEFQNEPVKSKPSEMEFRERKSKSAAERLEEIMTDELDLELPKEERTKTLHMFESLFFPTQDSNPEQQVMSDSIESETEEEEQTETELPVPKKMLTSISNEQRKRFEKIIIHIHGGGFIAMSSGHHQLYTRHLVNEIDVPLFSIDYRLAPHVQFPKNLEDCITAYFWIIDYVEKVIQADLKHITLLGDSAGGGLVVGLVVWLINNKQRIPDFVIPCYSALCLDTNDFRKSNYIGLNDLLLHYSALKSVHDFYVPKECPESENYYLSPVKAPKAILEEFPRMHFFISMEDPLRDDQLNLAYFLSKTANPNVKISCFEHLPHGVLTNRSKAIQLPRMMREGVIRALLLEYRRSGLGGDCSSGIS